MVFSVVLRARANMVYNECKGTVSKFDILKRF